MSRKSVSKTALLAVPLAAAFIVSTAGHADDRMNRSDHSSMSRHSDKVLSGGVGMAARDDLKNRSDDYELKLVFAATPSGDYLAEIPVTIKDRSGNTVVNAVSDGPWMFVDLPTGTYSVEARFNGRTETRQIAVTSGSQRIVYVRFPHRGEPDSSMNVSSAR